MNMKLLTVVGSLVLLSTPAFSQHGGMHGKMKEMKELTTEQRKEMAAKHEKMAACLKSSKPMKECHEEMKGMMGKEGMNCPMMENQEHQHD
jgi:hypothetical protein